MTKQEANDHARKLIDKIAYRTDFSVTWQSLVEEYFDRELVDPSVPATSGQSQPPNLYNVGDHVEVVDDFRCLITSGTIFNVTAYFLNNVQEYSYDINCDHGGKYMASEPYVRHASRTSIKTFQPGLIGNGQPVVTNYNTAVYNTHTGKWSNTAHEPKSNPEAKKSCNHVWKNYVGLTETYIYCQTCNQKGISKGLYE